MHTFLLLLLLLDTKRAYFSFSSLHEPVEERSCEEGNQLARGKFLESWVGENGTAVKKLRFRDTEKRKRKREKLKKRDII